MGFDVFEELLDNDNFQPHEIYANGEKDDNGQVIITDEDLINGNIPKKKDDDDMGDGGKEDKPDVKVETDKLLDKALESGKFGSIGPNDENDEEEDEDGDKSKDDRSSNKKSIVSGGDDTNPLKIFYKMMVEDGLWEDEGEEFDGSEQAFLEIKEKNLERMREDDLQEYLSSVFEQNPDGAKHGKALLAHLSKGGKIKDFIELHESADISDEELDSDDEATATAAAENLTRTYLKLIGWDKDDINNTIRNKKEKNTLVEYGKELLKPYQKKIVEIENKRESDAKADAISRRNDAIKYTTNVNDIVNTQERVGIIELPKTAKEKKALISYMLSPIETENGSKRTQLAEDFNKFSKDPEFSIFLAQSLRTWTQKKPTAGKKAESSSTKDSILNLLGSRAIPNSTGKRNQQAPLAPTKKADWNLDD